jgi:hypothetical protein
MEHFINKSVREELGYNLWLLRRERNLNLQRLSLKINVPTHILDDLERGKHFEFCAVCKLFKFYGKTMKIVFE